MESSMISTTNYMSKAQCSSDEESTWTFYIDQDFKDYPPCGTEDEYEYESENDSLLLSGCQSGSSMASASACSAVKKHHHHHDQVPSQGNCERFSGKRRKIKASFVDPELEDSATSPDNSPKVIDFNQFYMNSKEMMDPKTIFQGKGDIANQKTEGINFLGIENHCTALRRKGLCVAPVSMLYKCVS